MLDLAQRRPALVNALWPLIGAALRKNLDADAAALLETVRLWQPHSVEVRFYDARLAMRRRDFAEAARLLQALHDDGAGRKAELVRSILASCLFVQRDPAWRGHAEALVQDGKDTRAIAVARMLRGDAPLAQAFEQVLDLRDGASAQAAPRYAAGLRF